MDVMTQDQTMTAPLGGNEIPQTQKVANIKNAFTIMLNRHQPMRQEQIRDLELAVGKVIPEDQKASLREQGRKITEFPIPQQTLLYIAGMLQNDMVHFKAIPTKEGTEALADMHTELNEWAMNETRGYKHLATVGMHSAIAKRGVINLYWDYKDSEEGSPVMNPVDPLLVMFDPDPGQDRFCCYFPMLSVDDVLRIYKNKLTPEKVAKIKDKAAQYDQQQNRNAKTPISWAQRVGSDIRKEWNKFRNYSGDSRLPDYRGSLYTDNQLTEWVDAANGLYRTVEWHDVRSKTYKWVYSPLSPETPPQVIPDDKIDDQDHINGVMAQTTIGPDGSQIPMFPQAKTVDIIIDQVWVTTICPALLEEEVLFEAPHDVQGYGFQFKKVDCYDWHPDPTRVQSIIDSLDAPTKLFNYHKMSMLALLDDAMNPGIDAEEESISPQELPAWQKKQRGGIRFFRKGTQNRPMERQVPEEAFKLAELMGESSKEMIEFLSGIGQNAKGFQESSGESGVLFEQRKATTEVMIAYFMNQLTECARECFLYMDRLMQINLTEPRKLRLVGPDQETRFMTVNTEPGNMVNEGEYDFTPDPRTLGASQKAEKFLTLMQLKDMVPMDPISMMFIASKAIHYVDIPDAKDVEAFLQKRLADMMNQQDQAKLMQQKAAQLAMAGQAQDLVHKAVNGPNGGQAGPGKNGNGKRKQLPAPAQA